MPGLLGWASGVHRGGLLPAMRPGSQPIRHSGRFLPRLSRQGDAIRWDCPSGDLQPELARDDLDFQERKDGVDSGFSLSG